MLPAGHRPATSLPWSKGTRSGTRWPCWTFWFVPLDNSTSRNVKRHFIQRWNVHTWSHEIPHETRVTNFQRRFSVNVWCGVLGNRLIGPFVFDNNLTGNAYEVFLRNELPGSLESNFMRQATGSRGYWLSNLNPPSMPSITHIHSVSVCSIRSWNYAWNKQRDYYSHCGICRARRGWCTWSKISYTIMKTIANFVLLISIKWIVNTGRPFPILTVRGNVPHTTLEMTMMKQQWSFSQRHMHFMTDMTFKPEWILKYQ